MSPVREFKFACPVCHQHIQCETASSGKIIACPTCFRNIIVPQAPTGNTTKLILRGTQAPTLRRDETKTTTGKTMPARSKFSLAGIIAALIAGVTILILGH